jgi:threonine dehydrogenase-like Zn-dependent dehydrogenase
MKAFAVFPKEQTARVIDLEEPRLASPTSVKLSMIEVGVCGTDTEICTFRYGIPPDGFDHLIVGHESIAEVIEIGAGVTTLKPGDLVIPSVRRPCSREDCVACRSGNQDYCVTDDYTERGIKGAHGFLAERVVEEERYLTRVPGELRDVGVLTEPLTIAEKGLHQYCDVQRRLPWRRGLPREQAGEDARAVVLGAGPVGLLGCMLLLHHGFDTYVYSRGEPDDPRANLIGSIGANFISSEHAKPEEMAAQVGEIDVVYEAAGASQLAFDVLPLLGHNGVFIFTGVPGRKGKVNVAGDEIMRNMVLRNQAVIGTVNADRTSFQSAVEHLAAFNTKWPAALRSIITGRSPMSEFCEKATHKDGIKNVVTLSV